MILANKKPLALVGYSESITIKEILYALGVEHPDRQVIVVEPEELFKNPNPDYQYLNLAVRQDFILRKKVTAFLTEHELDRFTYIHNSAVIHLDACNISPGVVLGPQVGIAYNVTLEQDVMILGHCAIGHGSVIGEGSYLSGGVFFGGSVNVGKFCFLGMRVTVYDKVTLTDDVVVSSTSVVRKSIIDSGVYHGMPAKKMRILKR